MNKKLIASLMLVGMLGLCGWSAPSPKAVVDYATYPVHKAASIAWSTIDSVPARVSSAADCVKSHATSAINLVADLVNHLALRK